MRAGAFPPTTKRSRLPTALIALLLAVSGAGLFVLGLGATDAAEARARLRTRDALGSAEIALGEAAHGIVRTADLAAESGDDDSPLLTTVFLVGPDGEVLLPERVTFPALPKPPAEEAGMVRKILDAVDAEAAAGEDPLKALVLAESALSDFAHPDLVATLADRVAALYLAGGAPDRALFLSREIADDFAPARDLEGEPLAPLAHLRILGILEDPEARREEAVRFARRLADGSFDLPRAERDLYLERVAEALGTEPLPDDVRDRISLLDALESRVIPEARDVPAGLPDRGGWRHLVRDGDRGPEVFGVRRIEPDGRPHLFGYRLSGEEFTARLAAVAEAIAAEQGIRVEVGLLPVLSRGPVPGDGALVRRADLAGDLRGIVLRLSAAPSDDYRLLGLLHAGMTIAFAVALGAGLLLSVRAVRREIETARIRQHLVDNVSHELRTPLTTIRMYAEMLAEEADLPAGTRAEYLEWILSESERLGRLVTDVLDLSRLARGEARLEREELAPAEIATEAVERVRPLAEGRIETAVPEALPRVRADRDATVRILVNLLANALRYAGDDAPVRLEATREGGRIRWTVTDRGPGVEPEAVEHLFDRFYRAPRDARRVKGAGLGLALAREIARLEGGDVTLAATSPAGSTFALHLPVAEEAS